MTSRRFKVLLEWDAEDSVWVTYVPALNHLSTFADTKEAALRETEEAILGYLEAAGKEDLPIAAEDAPIELVEVEVTTA
jgi:predicted RNase H-like HicB family nuclease